MFVPYPLIALTTTTITLNSPLILALTTTPILIRTCTCNSHQPLTSHCNVSSVSSPPLTPH
jgi:hypothetical protein